MDALDGHTTLEVFSFLANARRKGRSAALVTIVGLEGSSARAVGAHMAVSEDGAYVGSFSGGCVEAAVVGEARRAIASGESRLVRLGRGSPYVDIRLPCGGSVDLLFQPDPEHTLVEAVAQRLASREPVTIELSPAKPWLRLGNAAEARNGAYRVRHAPRLKLLILGNGEESVALARLGLAFGAEVAVQSPDPAVVSRASGLGARASSFDRPSRARLDADRWTAIVLLFHDHDLDAPLLTAALGSEAFFVGAMGSKATHAKRMRLLLESGVSAESLARIRSPLGLIPSARDPSMLALSALAQIADEYRGAAP